MSLIDDMMEDFIIMSKQSVSDGEGGFETMWSEGEGISAVLTLNTSMQAKRAEQEDVTSVYTLTTNRDVTLPYQTVLKRVSDGMIFRVTTDGGDNVSPSVSSLNMSQVSAEKWELPT